MAGGMTMRELGSSGIKASAVGLGTFAIGGWFWGGTDEKKSIQAIQASLDSGVNLIDTAPIYGFGLAERIVGKALKGRRDKAVIATKVGLRWDTDKGIFDGYADDKSPSKEPAKYKIHKYLGPDGIRFEVEQSLKRLGTDYIDLYQTHWQEPTTPIEVTMEALEKLKAEGKIRAIGVSNVSLEQLKRYGKVASAQERFTLIDRSIVKKGLADWCVSNSIAILSYFSMEQGLLTGTMSPGRTFNDGDTRKTNPLFAPESISRINGIVAELRPFAEKYKATVSQAVIALTASQKGITHVLVGARDAAQAKENAGGGCIQLSREDLTAMNVIADTLAALRG
ncbi:MAG: aldo/keto reductase [Spirochaetia bacterium]|jgi:aryl-alcohol dehydrogenase-like predicted oxidoreductase